MPARLHGATYLETLLSLLWHLLLMPQLNLLMLLSSLPILQLNLLPMTLDLVVTIQINVNVAAVPTYAAKIYAWRKVTSGLNLLSMG